MISIIILPILATKWTQNLDENFFWKSPKSIHSFRFKRVSSADIVTYLGSLPNRSNIDILGMDIVLLKESAPCISISLANVINKSLESGIFEQDWKNARVTPIYKDDGDINDENNYRPISVIGHIAKMIESLVSYQIIDLLEEHSFISMDQSAYLKRHSTQTSLRRVIDDWLENVNDGAITGACLLDISKCFDSINHTILLKKLEMYGITSTEQNGSLVTLEDVNKLSNFTRKHQNSVILHVAFHRGRFRPNLVLIIYQWYP